MDIKKLAENIGIKEQDYLEILDLFVRTTSSDLNRLQAAMKEGAIQKVIERAHSIKGAAINMCLMEISEKAKEIEINARNHRLDGAIEAIRHIKERMNQITQSINGKE